MTDAAPADHARRLTEEARERRWPTIRPKDAATLILLDRSGPKPRVLLGRRHANHKFMPGKFVFPGGRIEAGDRQMNVMGTLDEHCERRLMARTQRPSAMRARALALAAIRETFEETGLLLGSPTPARRKPRRPARGASSRRMASIPTSAR